MRLLETWVGIGGAKVTAIFSAAPSTLSVPPQSRIYNDVLALKLGAHDDCEAGDLWLAISEEHVSQPRERRK